MVWIKSLIEAGGDHVVPITNCDSSKREGSYNISFQLNVRLVLIREKRWTEVGVAIFGALKLPYV